MRVEFVGDGDGRAQVMLLVNWGGNGSVRAGEWSGCVVLTGDTE